MPIALKRAYDAPSDDDGRRILVDRLWPRGLKRETARIDDWLKDIAPSHELRKWFDHDPEKWEAFRGRYRAELDSEASLKTLVQIAELASMEKVTLLYAAKDERHNNAVVLKVAIEERRFRNNSAR